MVTFGEKAKIKKAGNLNLGRSYVFTTLMVNPSFKRNDHGLILIGNDHAQSKCLNKYYLTQNYETTNPNFRKKLSNN